MKRGKIAYEGESDDSESDCEVDETEEKNDCPCVCHGAYQIEPELPEHQKPQKFAYFCFYKFWIKD